MTRPITFLLLTLLVACDSKPPAPGTGGKLSDPSVPETWVKPEWSPSWWYVLADVRDFVGAERWAALDTAWMAEKARSDLAEFGPKNQNPSEHMLAGLWRLGLARDGVTEAIVVLDEEVVWPLDTPGNRLHVAWRPRLLRWLGSESGNFHREKFHSAWRKAVAAGNATVAARIAEAYDFSFGRLMSDPLAAEAKQVVRKNIVAMENGHLPRGVLYLIERFGPPEGVRLGPVLDAVRRRYRDYEDETMPLPHPYDLHLQCLRLERLVVGYPDSR